MSRRSTIIRMIFCECFKLHMWFMCIQIKNVPEPGNKLVTGNLGCTLSNCANRAGGENGRIILCSLYFRID